MHYINYNLFWRSNLCLFLGVESYSILVLTKLELPFFN
jgi:hypothetical protein